ncbi:hypothetical protein FACS1894172_13510 [Spirochaetia bacterium]|nr:hypothetical protein FACS1894164_13390 [Spirochaetia bacterium]GHU33950.1 hypothetical protein FACS1894172_13510 [Spirochaetia bacterium]
MTFIHASVINIVLIVLLSTCSIQMLQLLDSMTELGENEGDIRVFVMNKSPETLVVFVTGYSEGAEVARIPPSREAAISITKGRTIYLVTGTTGTHYGSYVCNEDGKTWDIW